MSNDLPSSMERGYLLPIGCKDLIDLIGYSLEVAPWGIRTWRKNDSIKAPRLRVVRVNGEEVGILALAEALELAQSLEVDLVELKPKADPPVCMLMDYAELIRVLCKEDRENGLSFCVGQAQKHSINEQQPGAE